MKRVSFLISACVFFVAGALSNLNASTVDFWAERLTIVERINFSGDVPFYATAASGRFQSYVNLSSNGLGVSATLLEPTLQVDGVARDDLVWFRFDMPVQLLSATFGNVQGNDDFRLMYNQPLTFVLDAEIPSSREYDFRNLNLISQSFAFTVTGLNDDYFLTRLSFAAAPVPIPGAAVLLLSGLVGLVVIRRRRAA